MRTPARAVRRSTATRLTSIIFDPRFVIGFVLIVGSVAGVTVLVTAAESATAVYVSGRQYLPGDVIAPEDLIESEMRLTIVEDAYLLPGEIPEDELVVMKPIGAGELVPRSALGRGTADAAAIVVDVTGRLPGAVAPGVTVDVWATGADADDSSAPVVIAPRAIVVQRVQDESFVVGSDVVAVELLVPRDRIARIAQAQARRDLISIVPSAAELER
ncbi:hypothetical protein LH407_10980 [Antiquaquibacter oligotrophicus]|nr:hypothetical protein [Antiquaquibacter oligotrophicus]UDF12674.1 hypothetical protein LH407_10980 [Antiquaquibacter oligotrophicus]